MVGLLFAACEKMVLDEEEQGVEDSEKTSVVIRVANVEAGWGGASSRTLTDVSEVCSRVAFVIYTPITNIAVLTTGTTKDATTIAIISFLFFNNLYINPEATPAAVHFNKQTTIVPKIHHGPNISVFIKYA